MLDNWTQAFLTSMNTAASPPLRSAGVLPLAAPPCALCLLLMLACMAQANCAIYMGAWVGKRA